MLRFPLRDHVVQDLWKFGTFSVYDASPFEQYRMNIKHTYRNNSTGRNTCMNERVGMVGRRLDWTQIALSMPYLEEIIEGEITGSI